MSKTDIARDIQSRASKAAAVALSDLNPEAAKAAAARVGLAFAAAMSASPKPEAWANLDPASIATAVGASVSTDLYPGGPMPPVYLVPQGGALQWRITHRGLCELCRREGYDVRAVPIGLGDKVRQSFGLVVEHEQSNDPPPRTLEELFGIIVVVRGPRGSELAYLVHRQLIEDRRKVSPAKDRGPWRDWPIEMAQKTAILYLAARGSLPVSTSMRAAFEADPIEVQAIAEKPKRGRELPDYSLSTPPKVEEPEREHIEVDPETGEPLPEGF